jgi:hypothetical protein
LAVSQPSTKIFVTPEADVAALGQSKIATPKATLVISRPAVAETRLMIAAVPEDEPPPDDVNAYSQDVDELKATIDRLHAELRSVREFAPELRAIVTALINRHREMVQILTVAVDTAMTFTHATPIHPESLIERMQEQSAYLSALIREVEGVRQTSDDLHSLVAQRTAAVAAVEAEKAELLDKNASLTQTLADTAAALEAERSAILNFKALNGQLEASLEHQIALTAHANKRYADSEANKNQLLNDLDAANLSIVRLQNELATRVVSEPPDLDRSPNVIIFSQYLPPPVYTPELPLFSVAEEPRHKAFNTSSRMASASSRMAVQKVSARAPAPLNSPRQPSPEKNPTPIGPITPIAATEEVPVAIEQPPAEIQAAFTQVPLSTEPVQERLVVRADQVLAPRRTLHQGLKKPLLPLPEKLRKDADLLMIRSLRTLPEPLVVQAVAQLAVHPAPQPTMAAFLVPTAESTTRTETSTVASARATIQRRTISNLTHRLRAMEEQLGARSHELIDKRNQIQDLQQHLFSLMCNADALEARLAAAQRSLEESKGEVAAGLKLVTRLSLENSELRSLVAELSVIAKRETRRRRLVKFAQESEDVALGGEMRARLMMYGLRGKQPTKELQEMTNRYAMWIARWEGRRRELLENQRQQALAVLASMNLLRKDLTTEYQIGIPRNVPGFMVTSVQSRIVARKNNTTTGELNPGGRSRISEISSVPTLDEALARANAHNQAIGRTLQAGVVATPLSTG